jgi:hypothetical protein
LTAGVVRLRRGSKKSENAVLDLKMLFLDGHKLVPDRKVIQTLAADQFFGDIGIGVNLLDIF